MTPEEMLEQLESGLSQLMAERSVVLEQANALQSRLLKLDDTIKMQRGGMQAIQELIAKNAEKEKPAEAGNP